MSADALLQPFVDAWQRRFEPVTAEQIGYVAVGVPLELIVAAGAQPRRLFPDPAADTPLADRTMEPVFDGAVRSLYEQFLAGRFAALRAAVIPRCGEVWLQLHYFLQEAPHWYDAPALPPLHLFDLLKTPHWQTRLYVRGQIEQLAAALGSDAARLPDAIALLNRQRRLMAQADALRHLAAPRLTGVQMAHIRAAAGVLPPQEHIDALQRLLDGVASLPEHRGPRLMVKGSARDDLRLAALIESLGALVVADDEIGGDAAWSTLVDETAEPLDALARHCHRDLPTLRSLPQAGEDVRFLATVRAARVEGVVFHFERHDDTLGWDYPVQRKQLDACGVGSLCLKHQPYRANDPAADPAALRAQIDPWLKQLPRAASAGSVEGRP